jgi:hypothetical protein
VTNSDVPAGRTDVNATLPETVVTAKRDPTPPVALWMRMWDLVISNEQQGARGAAALSLANFHLQFEVETSMVRWPWAATITVTNPPAALADDPNLDQFTKVALYGGYQHARYGQLFAGQITYFEQGKTSPTETFLRIHAAAGDEAVNHALINTTLLPGATQRDVVNALLAVMAPYGITAGTLSARLDGPRSPRGRTLFGLPGDILRDVWQALPGHSWIDSDGKLHVLSDQDPLPVPTIELNSSTGMVNIPSIELGRGLAVQSLLDYRVTPGAAIRVNNREVNRIVASQGAQSSVDVTTVGQLQVTMPEQFDGLYQVLSVRHHGDNRGQAWYSDIMTRGINPETMKPSVG